MKKISTSYKVVMIVITVLLLLVLWCIYSLAANAGQSLDWRHYSLWTLTVLVANGALLHSNNQCKVGWYKKEGYEFFCIRENGNEIYQKTLDLKSGKRIFLAEFNKDGFCKRTSHYDFDDVKLAMEAFEKQTSA